MCMMNNMEFQKHEKKKRLVFRDKMHLSLECGQRGRWLGDTFSTGVSSSDIYKHQTPCAPRPLVINGHIMAGKQKSHSAPAESSHTEVEGKVK